MRNDRVLIPVLHTMLNVFRLVYIHIIIDKYPTNLFCHNNANVWFVWV